MTPERLGHDADLALAVIDLPSPAHPDSVIMVGNTPGARAGVINGIVLSVRWKEFEQRTTERFVVGIDDNFAQSGDSGAWVINRNGTLVGLVISGRPRGLKRFVVHHAVIDVLGDIMQ